MNTIKEGTILDVVPNSQYTHYDFSNFKKAKFIGQGIDSYYVEIYEGSVQSRNDSFYSIGAKLYFPIRFFTISYEIDNYEIY